MQHNTELYGSASVSPRLRLRYTKWLWTPLSFLYRHRGLIWAMAQRDLLTPYAGQMLGGFWALAHPLFFVTLLTVIFNFLLGTKFGGTVDLPRDYTVYLLSGLIPWQTFVFVLGRSGAEIVANANLVKQVVFPIEVLPIRGILTALVTFIVGIVFIIGYVLLKYGFLPWTYLLLLPLFLLQILWMSGTALFLSALGVYFRDLKDVISMLITAGVYLLPIIYMPGAMPSVLQPVIYCNPFSALVWCYQDALYFGHFESPWAWLVLGGASLGSFYSGFYVFQRLKPFFGNVL